MTSIKHHIVFTLATIAILQFSCANPKADYVEVQKLQDAAEQVIQRSPDYDTRIKSCEDAINALQTFLNTHKEGDWTNIAKNALSSWQARKASLAQELSSLSEQLYSRLKTRAIEESKKIHSASNIETIELGNRVKTKEGDAIKVIDTYSVRMRGAILGTHVFKLTVHVSGGIAMNTKSVFVNENANVEE